MDFSTRLRGINPTNSVFYSPEPRAEVYCLLMNFKISKLAYSYSPNYFHSVRLSRARDMVQSLEQQKRCSTSSPASPVSNLCA